MKKFYCLMLVIISIVSSCRYPFVKIYSNERKCFCKTELIPLMDSYAIDSPHEFAINSIVKNKNNCIGLYGYRFVSARGGKVIYKALKFEDSLYYYHPSKDSVLNKFAFEKFEQQYKYLFSPEEFEQLKGSYFKGNEIQARLF